MTFVELYTNKKNILNANKACAEYFLLQYLGFRRTVSNVTSQHFQHSFV